MISVIINTRNEEENIVRLLKSLRNQEFEDLEIIVVDNNSVDKTAALAQEFGARVFNFGPERSEQKNFGAHEAKGEWLLFVDADMELTPKVLRDCQSRAGTNFDALVIPEMSVGEGFWAVCRSLEKRMYFNDPRVEAPRFFSREIFFRAGGYSEGMVSGEDWDLREKVKKAGGRIGRAGEVLLHHEGRLTLSAVIKKKFYYSRHSRQYLSKNPIKPVDFLFFIFRPGYFRNIKFALADPAHFFGLIFLKTVELFTGLTGWLVSR